MYFECKFDRTCRSAFERTVSEAILIQLIIDSKEQTLNTRGELGAYQFPQLKINERARRRNISDKVEMERT